MEFSQGRLQLEGYTELLAKRKQEYEKQHPQKITEEYQEFGIELENHFHKNTWFLLWKYDIKDLRYALAICKAKNIDNINYLIGIVNRRYN